MKTGVIEAERGSTSQFFRKLEILVCVPAGRTFGSERDGAQRSPAGNQRHNHCRRQTELLQNLEMLYILSKRNEHRIGDIGIDFRFAAAHHVRHAITAMSDGLPAFGIVAAVLGVIVTM